MIILNQHARRPPGRPRAMIKHPAHLKTIQSKREWLEHELPIPDELKRSIAYRTLTDEAKIVLMLIMDKAEGGRHAST